MARCKNLHLAGSEVRPAKATFADRKIKRSATCEDCGARVRYSNLARHRRTQHQESGYLPPKRTLVVSPRLVVSPLRLKLKLQLPAVTKALDERMTVEATVEEDPERRLPTTPDTEEELMRGLARLYSARVPQMSASSISYRLTKDFAAVASNPDQRHELREIMRVAGLVLHTKEEWDRNSQEAEARGKDEGLRNRPLSVDVVTQTDDMESSTELFKNSFMLAPMVLIPASSLSASLGFKGLPFRFD